jgi:hypothetical protein
MSRATHCTWPCRNSTTRHNNDDVPGLFAMIQGRSRPSLSNTILHACMTTQPVSLQGTYSKARKPQHHTKNTVKNIVSSIVNTSYSLRTHLEASTSKSITQHLRYHVRTFFIPSTSCSNVLRVCRTYPSCLRLVQPSLFDHTLHNLISTYFWVRGN